MENTAKLSSKFLCVLLLALPLSFANAKGTQEATADITEEPAKVEEDMEVIGVTGQKPLLYFKYQMEKAELDFYDAFNAVADNEKYKVKCRKENRLGSNIKERVCYPQFVLDRMAQETQDALNSGLPYPSLQDIEFAVKDVREESMKYVEKVVTENPQLLEKLLVLNEKQNEYAAKKNQR